MNNLLRDVLFGLRMMVQKPGLTIISILALGLGIGAVSTQLSVINGSLWKGLPYENSEELMHVQRWNDKREEWRTAIPIHDFLDIVEQQNSFEGLFGWFGGTINIVYDENPVRLQGPRVSASFTDVLKVQPIIGAGFQPEHDKPGAPPVALLSYGTWQAHFNGDKDVVGQSVKINGHLGTVIGVMPKDFRFPFREDLWIPLQSSFDFVNSPRGQGWDLEVMGRLKSSVSVEVAEAEITGIIAKLAEEYPDSNEDFRMGEVRPVMEELIGDGTENMMFIMLAVAVLLLFLACANVTNLILIRFSQRTKELAIKSAMGATRTRIITQIVVESTVLSILGALLGVFIAFYSTETLMMFAPQFNMPYWFDFTLNPKVLAGVVMITMLVGILSGVVPAFKASRLDFYFILKDDTRTSTSLHMGIISRLLVVMQICMSSVVLIVTGLMVRSLQEISQTDYGFDTRSVFTARMGLFGSEFDESEERYQFWSTLERNLQNRADVKEATIYERYRWGNTNGWSRMELPNVDYPEFEDKPIVLSERNSPNYFKTMGVKLLAGRDFNEADIPNEGSNSEPVIIINEAMAKSLFPGKSPIDKMIRRSPFPNERDNEGNIPEYPWWRIIGVVPSMQMEGAGNDMGLQGPQQRGYYLPYADNTVQMFMTVAVRGFGSPESMQQIVREEVMRLDSTLPLYAVGTPAQIIAEDTSQQTILTNIFKIFGVVAVFLASIGIYGVVSFSVQQRSQEFGIRASLGATASSLRGMVMGSGSIQLVIGLILGLPLAAGMAYLMRTQVYAVSWWDLATYVGVVILLSTVTLVACFIPAYRASKVDPSKALHQN